LPDNKLRIANRLKELLTLIFTHGIAIL